MLNRCRNRFFDTTIHQVFGSRVDYVSAPNGAAFKLVPSRVGEMMPATFYGTHRVQDWKAINNSSETYSDEVAKRLLDDVAKRYRCSHEKVEAALPGTFICVSQICHRTLEIQ